MGFSRFFGDSVHVNHLQNDSLTPSGVFVAHLPPLASPSCKTHLWFSGRWEHNDDNCGRNAAWTLQRVIIDSLCSESTTFSKEPWVRVLGRFLAAASAQSGSGVDNR